MQRTFTAVVIAVATLSAGRAASAQTTTYKARLSPVPVANLRDGITGLGAATATLAGRSLSVRGTFEGMKTAATIAQIHLGPRGIRGPVMFDLKLTSDLKLTKGTSGTLTGTFTLTPEQVEAVKAGRFYIQVHSESAPDGNLWGWLLP
jgi:CHRD domain-containing protein